MAAGALLDAGCASSDRSEPASSASVEPAVKIGLMVNYDGMGKRVMRLTGTVRSGHSTYWSALPLASLARRGVRTAVARFEWLEALGSPASFRLRARCSQVSSQRTSPPALTRAFDELQPRHASGHVESGFGHSPRKRFVRASQPLAQPAGGFVWRRSIEGHQRHRAPGNADDAGAPSVVRDRGHFDQVRVSADQFFEAMDGDAHG